MSDKLILGDQENPMGSEEGSPESWQVESWTQWPQEAVRHWGMSELLFLTLACPSPDSLYLIKVLVTRSTLCPSCIVPLTHLYFVFLSVLCWLYYLKGSQNFLDEIQEINLRAEAITCLFLFSCIKNLLNRYWISGIALGSGNYSSDREIFGPSIEEAGNWKRKHFNPTNVCTWADFDSYRW